VRDACRETEAGSQGANRRCPRRVWSFPRHRGRRSRVDPDRRTDAALAAEPGDVAARGTRANHADAGHLGDRSRAGVRLLLDDETERD